MAIAILRRAPAWYGLLPRARTEAITVTRNDRRRLLATWAGEGEEEDGKGVGPSSAPGPSTLLYHDDNTATPDLDALDELNPVNATNVGRSRGSGKRQWDRGPGKKEWDKAFESVQSSFTVKQLQQLAKDAQVPRKIMSQLAARPAPVIEAKKGLVGRPVKGNSKASGKRARLTKALLMHRFGLQDPYEVKPSVSKARATPLSKLEMKMPHHALFFFAADKALRGRRLLQENLATLRPGRLLEDGLVQVTIVGEEERLEQVQKRIEAFITTIAKRPAVLTSGQSLIESRHLRLISQLSSTFVEAAGDEGNLVIYSLDEADNNLAQNLLAQVDRELLLAKQRNLYSYAAPPVPAALEMSMPEYAFSHHVGSEEPLPLLARTTSESISASLFRLTRQRGGGQAAGGGIDDLMSEQEHAVLRMAGDRQTLMSLDDEQQGARDDILDQLRAQQPGNEEGREETISISFGHLLFDNVAANRLSSTESPPTRIQSLLRPPLAKAWPLQYALDRLPSSPSSAQLPDRLDSPAFVPCVPPVAHLLQPGYKRREDSYNPIETASSRKAQELLRQREWSLTIERLSRGAAEEQSRWEEEEEAREIERKSKFPDNVDEASCTVQDLVELVYASSEAGEKAQELRVLVEVDKGNGGWKALWVNRKEVDVVAPESSVDFRLEHLASIDALQDSSAESQGKIEEIVSSLGATSFPPSSSMPPAPMSTSGSSPPAEVELGGKRLLLVNATRTTRVSWSLLDPAVKKDSAWVKKLVLDYKIGESDDGSSRREMRIEYRKVKGHGTGVVESAGQEADTATKEEEVGEKGEDKSNVQAHAAASSAPRWPEVSKLLAPFLEKGYLTIPGTLR